MALAIPFVMMGILAANWRSVHKSRTVQTSQSASRCDGGTLWASASNETNGHGVDASAGRTECSSSVFEAVRRTLPAHVYPYLAASIVQY